MPNKRIKDESTDYVKRLVHIIQEALSQDLCDKSREFQNLVGFLRYAVKSEQNSLSLELLFSKFLLSSDYIPIPDHTVSSETILNHSGCVSVSEIDLLHMTPVSSSLSKESNLCRTNESNLCRTNESNDSLKRPVSDISTDSSAICVISDTTSPSPDTSADSLDSESNRLTLSESHRSPISHFQFLSFLSTSLFEFDFLSAVTPPTLLSK